MEGRTLSTIFDHEHAVSAVILAAGRSSRFLPPLYDRPKGLFVFRGEVLVERQIRQLIEAGCEEVWVVLGYEKERFFYLEEVFPQVRLVVNEHWADEGNTLSIACAQKAFSRDGAWLCCADHWYAENPFASELPAMSCRMIADRDGAGCEFAVSLDDGCVAGFDRVVGRAACMVGAAWLTKEFVDGLLEAYAQEREGIGGKTLFWEQVWARHAKELPLAVLPERWGFREFNSLGDLVGRDPAALENVSEDAMVNICRLLECKRGDIECVEPLNKGLTNASFSFVVRGERYVYRQPGWSSGNMVDRAAEVVAQNLAVSLGIDSSVIAIGEEGWKLSRYIEADHAFSYDNPADISAGIAQIRKLHAHGVACSHEINPLCEGDRLLGLASSVKGDAKEWLAGQRAALGRLWHHVELDGVPKVLCHNDAYAVNWICGRDGGLCLIDWEYAGKNDPYNDLATLVLRDGLSRSKYDEIVGLYLQRRPSSEELRHAYGVAAGCAWYWLCWCLFKDTLGEDGFFMLPSWRALKLYLPLALEMYGDAPMNGGLE